MERTEWLQRLETFLADCSFNDDIDGVVACGSIVAGHGTPHSDLDVQIVLKDSVAYRERGNKVVDGLLIEYFANPPRQTELYFEEDLRRNKRITATMFATGEVILDKTGSVAQLRQKAQEYLRRPFSKGGKNELAKYALWDDLDNLQGMDLQSPYGRYAYYVTLQRLYTMYVEFLGADMGPTSKLERYFHDADWRAKHAIEEFPDAEFVRLFEAAAGETGFAALKDLTDYVQEKTGGFEIDGWVFRSKTEC